MTRVDLITGFLGAGKTTFILQYAAWLRDRGTSFAVIENEFGAAGCDGAILKDVGIDVAELSGGCICCSLKVDFVYALEKLSGKAERIIVEPSGIFSPKDFFEVMNSPLLNGKCEIGFVAAVVDPFSAGNITEAAAELFDAQIRSAGVVLMSMTDTLSSEQHTSFAEKILTYANGAEIALKTTLWKEFTDADFHEISTSGSGRIAGEKKLSDHASLFRSTTLMPKKSFDEAELLEKLHGMMNDTNLGKILRIKGAVKSRQGGLFWISCTPSRICVKKMKQGEPMVNVIGSGLVREKIRSELVGI